VDEKERTLDVFLDVRRNPKSIFSSNTLDDDHP
jgi:hypothetical protein